MPWVHPGPPACGLLDDGNGNLTSGANRTVTWTSFDRVASIVLNAAGGFLTRVGYDAWGRMRHVDGTDDTAGSLPGSFDSYSTKQFTGQEHIPDVGLLNYNARIYDPEIGRMMSADPTVPDPFSGQSYNRFSYVDNGPLSATDPSGLQDDSSCGDSCIRVIGKRSATDAPGAVSMAPWLFGGGGNELGDNILRAALNWLYAGAPVLTKASDGTGQTDKTKQDGNQSGMPKKQNVVPEIVVTGVRKSKGDPDGALPTRVFATADEPGVPDFNGGCDGDPECEAQEQMRQAAAAGDANQYRYWRDRYEELRAAREGQWSASANVDPNTGKPIPESPQSNSGNYAKPDTSGYPAPESVDQAGTVTQRAPGDPGPMQAHDVQTPKPQGFWQQVVYSIAQWARVIGNIFGVGG